MQRRNYSASLFICCTNSGESIINYTYKQYKKLMKSKIRTNILGYDKIDADKLICNNL